MYTRKSRSWVVKKPISADSARAMAMAMQAVRTSRRMVSICCTGLGAPSCSVGMKRALSGFSQATRIGSMSPGLGTMTMPMPARKRESRVRASCMLPHICRSPWEIITSPANTLNTSTACGAPDQPPAGAGIRMPSPSRSSTPGGQARIGVCSAVGSPISR